MAGNIEGGRKAADTNRSRYGADFYAKIGRKGGRKGRTGGFAADPERARIAGTKGGKKSRRGPIRKGYYDITDTNTGEVIGTVYSSSEKKAIKMAKEEFFDRLSTNSILEATLNKKEY